MNRGMDGGPNRSGGPELDATSDPLLATLSRAARRLADEAAGPGPTPVVWHRLQARRLRTRTGGRRRLLVGVSLALGVLALAIGLRIARGPRPVTYAVGGGAAEQGGYIRGVGAAGSNVQFSDGTRVDLARGARLSVLARGGDGARLRVEDGEAHFEVVHRPRAAWTVEAGPFVVYVTGTSFDVRWSGTDETVEVRLRSGSVRVAGPFLPERVTLRPGQRLTARLARGELRIEESLARTAPVASVPVGGVRAPAAVAPAAAAPSAAARPDAPPPAPVLPGAPVAAPPGVAAAAPSAARAVALPDEAAAAPSAGTVEGHAMEAPTADSADANPDTEAPVVRAPSSSSHWRKLHRPRPRRVASSKHARFAPTGWPSAVALGAGAEVLAQVEAHGVDQTLAEVEVGPLSALADAARYAGRRDLATRALLAERARFPGTPPAHVAAFLLGRLADDRDDTSVALGWYRRYLAEVPRGPYAAEALGREMLNVERLHGRAAAQPIAAEYVRRFQNGTYLLQAHSILANP